MNETVNIQVKEDGSRAVIANMNEMADSTDKAGASTDALQKLMKQMNATLGGLQAAIDRLNSTLGQQASATQKVVQSQNQAAASTQTLTKAVAAQAETEAAATSRIQAMVAASLEQAEANKAAALAAQQATSATAAQASVTAEAAAATQASVAAYTASAGAAVKQIQEVEALSDAVGGNIKTIDQWRNVEGLLVDAQQRGVISTGQYNTMIKQLDAQLPGLTASIQKEQAALVSLTSKYDPLAAKMTKLQADEKLLNDLRAKGVTTGAAYEKIMAGISAQKVVVSDGIEKGAEALGHFSAGSSAATREYGVLIGELARGNWSRLEGSLVTLGNQTGLLAKAFTGLGITLLGLTAVALALGVALYKGAEQQEQLNAALIVTGHTAGVTEDSITALAATIAGTGKATADTTQLLQSLVGTGRVTSDTFADVGRAASNAMKLTGDSVESVTQQFEKLYDDPVKWADDMDQKFHFLTLDVRDHAQSLQDVGDKYGAAEVIAKAFADNTSGRVKELTANMGYLATAVQSVSNYLGNVKQFWFDLGKDDTPVQQFTKAKQAYTEWDALVKSHNINIYDPANNEVLAYGTKLWNQMAAARDKVVGDQAYAQAQQQQDSQRQSLLEAGKNIDSINDKTQKQITLQTKLNQLADSYKKINALDPNDARLKGVSFNANGDPSGGGFASKKAELEQQANGKPKAGPSADSLIAPWVKYQKELSDLEGTIDPTIGAMKKLTDAQDLLNLAVSRGDLTQDQADFKFAQYQALLADAVNPLGAFQKKLDDQVASLNASGKATDATVKAEQARQDLLKQGITLTDEQVQGIQAQYEQIDTLTSKQQIYNRIQKSVIDQTKSYVDELTVLQQMQAKGNITQDQANQYLVQSNPDLFANTAKQMQVQLTQYQDYYKEIDALSQANFLSESDRQIAMANLQQKIDATRLQGTQSFLTTLASMQGTQSKKGAAIAKAAAIAQATISTYQAATGAYASAAAIPYIGWLLGPVAAGAAVVAGLANISKIRSTNYGAYRTGGEFTVGGNGGTDSQRVSFMASPGEKVSINTPAQARAIERMGENPRGGGVNVTQHLTQVVSGNPNRRTRDQLARDQRRAAQKEYAKSSSAVNKNR